MCGDAMLGHMLDEQPRRPPEQLIKALRMAVDDFWWIDASTS
jgi:hypothetical protein